MAEVGLSARTHQLEGSTPRTLAGSVLENSDDDHTSDSPDARVHNRTAGVPHDAQRRL